VSKLSGPETKTEFELKLNSRFEVLNRLSYVDLEWVQMKAGIHYLAKNVLAHTNGKKTYLDF
jgi:hypothetical protein